MSHKRYKVLINGHTHQGKELKKGDVVVAHERTADRYPNVFELVGETAPASAGESQPAAETQE
jgi:hypothetical protein